MLYFLNIIFKDYYMNILYMSKKRKDSVHLKIEEE